MSKYVKFNNNPLNLNTKRIPSIIYIRKTLGINSSKKIHSLNTSRENSINKSKILQIKNNNNGNQNKCISRANKLLFKRDQLFSKGNYSSVNLTHSLNNTLNQNLNKTTSNILYLTQSEKSSLNLQNFIINISLSKKNKFENKDYKKLLSKLIRDEYSESILKSLFEDEKINENFLSYHKITDKMRTRMVDWMIEVLSNYKCDESTFFESVNIMDRYFKECEKKNIILQPTELHLIGIVSMFIASKYQDIYPLRLKIVKDKIAHNKLSCQEIKDKEDEITRYLDYNLGLPTMWDFINLYLEEIFYINCNKHHIKNQILLDTYYKNIMTEEDEALANVINKKYTKNMLNLLKYVCVYLAKMNCHDYQLMQKKHSLLAASTIFVAIKICEQINKEEYINDYFTEKLNEISNNSENDIIKTAQKILYNAQNFDTKFNGLENLKKVHFNAIIELKETK